MSATHVRAAVALLDHPHHDGSDAYVLERPDALGGEATVRIRVPRASAVDAVVLRAVSDGEPHSVQAEIDEENETETWWRATLSLTNPSTSYRWLLSGGTVSKDDLKLLAYLGESHQEIDHLRVKVPQLLGND